MKCHYPDVFCAAMLNAQPLGFYAPAQLVRDAREHGVDVRPVDINHSDWDATLEPDGEAAAFARRIHPRHAEQTPAIASTRAMRLGLRQIKGLAEADAARLLAARGINGDRPFSGVRDLWRRSGLTRAVLERLADADAFRSVRLTRRQALWQVRALAASTAQPAAASSGIDGLPLFAGPDAADGAEPAVTLPEMPAGEHVVNDYRTLALSLKAHPVSFVRDHLARRRIAPCERLAELASGTRIAVAGLVLVRQRPGTAKGVIFETLEDETGIANIIVWPKVFERYRTTVIGSRFVAVTGKVQSEQGVIHVVADRLEDLTPLLARLSEEPIGNSGLARADEVRSPVDEHREKTGPRSRLIRLIKEAPELKADIERMVTRTRQVMPAGRNFH